MDGVLHIHIYIMLYHVLSVYVWGLIIISIEMGIDTGNILGC